MSIERKILRLYAVTDRTWLNGRTLLEDVEKCLKGGVTLVQLREKNTDYDTFLKSAKEMKLLCGSYGVPLIINDNVDIAVNSDADGVHLGQNDTPIAEARRILGAGKIIGATAKTVEQAKKAQEDGADYLGSGAVFGSATKTDAVKMDILTLRAITESVDIPVAAIGGITLNNIRKLTGSGIAGAAIASGIFASDDIEKTAEELYERIGDIV